MGPGFFDLHVAGSDLERRIYLAGSLGWDGACFSMEYDRGFSSFLKELEPFRNDPGFRVFSGALINAKKPAEVRDKARSALDAGADIVLVDGGSEEINRAASECWEVDVLCHPENVSGKDLMDQKSSGIDHIVARFMAEKSMALEIDVSQLLDSYGRGRSQLIGRMRQNVLLAKKYGVPLMIASGATDAYGLRSPHDLLSVGIALGMDSGLAKKSVEGFPSMVVKKSIDRRDPNVLLKGLEVLDWGEAKPEKKRMYGWY